MIAVRDINDFYVDVTGESYLKNSHCGVETAKAFEIG